MTEAGMVEVACAEGVEDIAVLMEVVLNVCGIIFFLNVRVSKIN